MPLLLLLSLAWPATRPAQRLQPLTEAVVLEGRVDGLQVQVKAPSRSERSGEVHLELPWRVSEQVDLARSTLGVAWDGVPLRTAPLADLSHDGTPVPLRVALPRSADGYGDLSVRTQLVVPGDPCDSARDRAWLVVEPEAALVWTPGPHEPPAAPATFDDWVAAREAVAVQLDAGASDDPTLVLAALELDHALRDRGVAPDPDATRTWTLAVDPLARRPAHAAIELVVADTGVTLRARTAAQARAAIRTWSEGWGRRCPATGCLLPPQQAEPAMEHRPSQADPLAVFTVADAGHPRGWVSRGAGRRQLRMVWPRPPGTEAQQGTRLLLRIDHVEATRLAPESRVVATMAGRPLGTWTLGEPGDLVVEIPEALRDEPVWVVDLEAQLWPREDERCRADDADGLWLVVDGASGLHVPRTEAPTGLAAFAEGPAPSVGWDRTPTATERAALASVLWPLRDGRPLAHLPADACRAARCLRLGDGEALRATDGHWTDHDGGLALPLLTSAGAALIAEGPGAVLSMSAPSVPAPPRWTSLSSAVALSLDDATGWQPLGGPADGAVVREVAGPAPEGRADDDTAWRRVADLAFGLLFLLAAGLSALWVWAGVRRDGPVEEL